MQPFHWNKSPQEDQTLIKLTACNKLVQQKFSWTISWTIFQLEKEPWFVYFWRNFPIKIKTSWFPQSLLIISYCAFEICPTRHAISVQSVEPESLLFILTDFAAIEYLWAAKLILTTYILLLAPQSGALRISTYRDFLPSQSQSKSIHL